MRRPRARKPSRFRRPIAGPQPGLDIGQKVGRFEIMEYLGYSATKPHEPVRLKVEHHWYRVQCDCGTIEVHTQQQLIDTRRHRMCKTCLDRKLKEST